MSLFIILAFVLSALSMPLIIKICEKLSLYDYTNARKIHSGNIPRLGGIGIALAFFISAGLYLKSNTSISLMANLPVLVAALIVFVFAFFDDILNFHASVKLAAQLTACGIVMFNNYRFTQIFSWQLPVALSYLITFLWILGLINAYNLIDGMDGLCGSLSWTVGMTIGIIHLLTKNQIAGLSFIFAAAITGFLLFNKPPAKIFMGDCGSQFLGFMIAILPLYPASRDIEFNKFIVMIVLTSFPVFDTIAAIWRRIRDKKPIMVGDRSHLHHKLLNLNYSKYKALILIDCIQVLVCISVIVATLLERHKASALLAETMILQTMFFSIIHFTNRKVMMKKQQ
ncbi:MAG: undecaprenyl/decaprenyl-phosphate alpha-N-acetylglucosaminyl 1-phosphate transferase [Treponema sp.]|nr:undecaprenyl/decaprenyl-phosphate alpha-N-acetylglucosaminyl 1-phosphate transferase [Treponema sp.]